MLLGFYQLLPDEPLKFLVLVVLWTIALVVAVILARVIRPQA